MAGRESSGKPSGEQGGRRPSVGGVRGGRDRGKSERDKAKADPSPPFPQKARDWVRDDRLKERREWERIVKKRDEERRGK